MFRIVFLIIVLLSVECLSDNNYPSDRDSSLESASRLLPSHKSVFSLTKSFYKLRDVPKYFSTSKGYKSIKNDVHKRVIQFSKPDIESSISSDNELDFSGLKQSRQTYVPTTTTTSIVVTPSQSIAIQPLAVAVAALAIALAVAIPTSLQANRANPSFAIDPSFLPTGFVNSNIPVNNNPLPVNEPGFNPDGCGDGSVQLNGTGQCFPLLKRGNCGIHQWLTLDPIRLEGRCTTRLCGRRRVFVGSTELCHDMYDTSLCRGGRRLYYSAYGDSVCDCPIGQYPFPRPEDDCVPLFTQGPCPARHVVSLSPAGALTCTPAECQTADGRSSVMQSVVSVDGVCYALGSRGPCNSISHMLGYDVFKRQPQCTNVEDPSSPYSSSPQEEESLDRVYNQLYPEYDDVRVWLIRQNVNRNDTAQRRQDTNTVGVFQLPSSLPDSLLVPCRPGARRGLNYKCTNPLVPRSQPREILPAVRSVFKCSAGTSLQVTAQCANDNRSASCGPSYRYNQFTGQCRSIF